MQGGCDGDLPYASSHQLGNSKRVDWSGSYGWVWWISIFQNHYSFDHTSILTLVCDIHWPMEQLLWAHLLLWTTWDVHASTSFFVHCKAVRRQIPYGAMFTGTGRGFTIDDLVCYQFSTADCRFNVRCCQRLEVQFLIWSNNIDLSTKLVLFIINRLC